MPWQHISRWPDSMQCFDANWCCHASTALKWTHWMVRLYFSITLKSWAMSIYCCCYWTCLRHYLSILVTKLAKENNKHMCHQPIKDISEVSRLNQLEYEIKKLHTPTFMINYRENIIHSAFLMYVTCQSVNNFQQMYIINLPTLSL